MPAVGCIKPTMSSPHSCTQSAVYCMTEPSLRIKRTLDTARIIKIAESHVLSKMDASSFVRPDDKSNIVTTIPTVPTKTEIPPSSQFDDEAKKTEKLNDEGK